MNLNQHILVVANLFQTNRSLGYPSIVQYNIQGFHFGGSLFFYAKKLNNE